jgi:SAM-dependent methyltransferase
MMSGTNGVLDQLTATFRDGGGVPQSAYTEDLWDGMGRFTLSWFENLLTQQWLPAMPDVQAKLARGVQVADIGCGRGQALIKLAQGFPHSRYIGYDIFGPTIARATTNAQAAGVADRVRFAQRDVSQGLPKQYDVITTFDVVHDAVDLVGLLQTIRQGLREDGIYVCVDVNCSAKLKDNQGPLGAMFHGFSVLYCMTTSLAGGGMGLVLRTAIASPVWRGGKPLL